MQNGSKNKAEIWAIGGGKGGTGKTFLTCSLGVHLAGLGKKVTLLDLDLGGANLHSFLKTTKSNHSLTDFFNKKADLNEIVTNTDIPNLNLITGDIHTLDPENIKYLQKLKLFRHIKTLESDIILLDLGAGSHLNTIDSFLIADKMVVVINPEITSIENLYQFLKKVVFRKVNLALAQHDLKEKTKNAWIKREGDDFKSLTELFDYFKTVSPEIDTVIKNVTSNFRIYLILNQVKENDQIIMGHSIKSVIRKYFGIKVSFVGFTEESRDFRLYFKKDETRIRTKISSTLADEIAIITENLLKNNQLKFVDNKK